MLGGVRGLLLLGLLVLLPVPAVRAGMPAPLPENVEVVLRVRDSTHQRLRAISFFTLGLLLCAGAVRLLWNYLQRDFPRLPRLTYGRSLAVTLLWGLLFFIVLTMISGARELMTPGAWEKQGLTYRLSSNAPAPSEIDPTLLRKQHLERLRTALWLFAARHSGRFPSTSEVPHLPEEIWTVPGSGGLRYQYVPGLSAERPATLLAFEPELDVGQRFVLWSNGDIVSMRSSEISSLHRPEKRP